VAKEQQTSNLAVVQCGLQDLASLASHDIFPGGSESVRDNQVASAL